MSDSKSNSPRILDRLRPRRPRWRGLSAGTLALSSLMALTAIVTSSCGDDPDVIEAPRLGATLELAAGEVVLIDDNGDESRLLSKTPLPNVAQLRTGPGARALVRLGDGTRVFLRDNTRVELDGRLKLLEGHAWVEGPPLERDQQPLLHAIGDGVTVSVSDGGASLSLVDGQAEIFVAAGLAIVNAPGGRTEVDPGERALVSGDAAPTVEPVKFWDDWTGGMGDRSASGSGAWVGSGSIYAIDQQAGPGSKALPLAIQRQTVKAALDDQIAETMVDQTFFNPSGTQVEGWYWFTVPEDAMLVGFALETNGQLIEGEVVERKQAQATYEEAIQRDSDPALLEWIDARTVRARIYPIPAAGTRRVVIRYQQLLTETEGKLRYAYPMAAPVGREVAAIEEFSLEVTLRDDMAERYTAATRTDARVEGEDRDRVTMRRSGYIPRADFELELTRATDEKAKKKAEKDAYPLSVNLFEPGNDQADYLMVRWHPDFALDTAAPPPGEVVVVVDTSAAGDPAEHQTKLAVAEALLRSLSEGDRFALVGADVSAEVLYPKEGLAEATPEAISAALERVAARGAGGATDLGAIFEQALDRVHGLEQPAIVYIGDGLATSGERSGDALADHLRRSMTGSRARLYTVGVGNEIDEPLLTRLAQVGGGDSLRVETAQHAVVRALELSGALKTPTITDLEIDLGEGLDDVFYNADGKLSRGQELVMLARTHHDLPDEITIRGRFAGEAFESKYELDEAARSSQSVTTNLVPRLWARAYVDRLLADTRGAEAVRGKVLSLGLEYGLMTPFTSFLALDSENAYAQQGIQRRRRNFPMLTADASWSRATADEFGGHGPVIGAFLAAASAPFGCGKGGDAMAEEELMPMSPPPSVTQTRSKGEEGKMGAPRQQSGPNNSPSSGLDGRGLGGQGGEASGDGIDYGIAGKLEASSSSPNKQRLLAEKTKIDNMLASSTGEREKNYRSRSEVARELLAGRPLTPPPISRDFKLPCSDAASRGLPHRKVLWERRLALQVDMASKLSVYESSVAACEVERWKDQQLFLQLLQARAGTEAEIRTLLGHFATDTDAQKYLARALLRRLVEPELIATVELAIFGAVDWHAVDAALALETDPDARLTLLANKLGSSGDPDGERRMLELLAELDQLDEAIARGRRLRDQGMMTAGLAEDIGELLVREGREDEARRLFSEIVEFAPDSPQSRRLLGDVFMRHRWYADAYRQYDLLLGLDEGPEAAIRLARAAAGTERVDEGLRILRRVYSGEGRPGQNDPRRWARLHAAALLAGLLLGDSEAPRESLTRELRRLSLFDAPGTWDLLLWEDLDVQLVLAAPEPNDEDENDQDKKEDASPPDTALTSDAVDAALTGLYALHTTSGATELSVRHRGQRLGRDVRWRRITITWDGEEFKTVDTQEGTIEAKRARATEPADPTPDDPTPDDAG